MFLTDVTSFLSTLFETLTKIEKIVDLMMSTAGFQKHMTLPPSSRDNESFFMK